MKISMNSLLKAVCGREGTARLGLRFELAARAGAGEAEVREVVLALRPSTLLAWSRWAVQGAEKR